MKKYLILYAAAATLLLAMSWRANRRQRGERQRLERNMEALQSDMRRYRTERGEQAASISALTLRCNELETLRADDAQRIRSLGIRLRRAESLAATATRTEASLQAPLRDTLPALGNDSLRHALLLRPGDTLRAFRWSDPWVEVEGVLSHDRIVCRVRSVDTLHQVVHRVPRRFLFIRYGIKELRQEIVSSNPHTRIVYATHVRIERRRKQR